MNNVLSNSATATGIAYLHGFSFCRQVAEISATSLQEVVPALQLVEKRVAEGLHAAGFINYEAAGGLNSDLTTCAPGPLPLLWFGLFQERSPSPLPDCDAAFSADRWHLSLNEEDYFRAVASIRDLIAAGDCYQINFTMKQGFSFSGSPLAFFQELCRSQRTPYNCYLETGKFRILSASPELFFSLKDGLLTTRPMKGTASRGRWHEEDLAQRQMLRENLKELAENVMIVDLLRNDMGMVSKTGSVRVDSLFDVETHATVHQMTSTIRSRLKEGVGFVELLQALFPCGSVTGAPKRRSMEIIADLEDTPRGIYTGCLGYLSPGGEATFSVAIRTAILDLEKGMGELGVGSGITFDSDPVAEYRESISKGRFAREGRREFHLIESLLYDGTYFLLERHLARLRRSAAYFSYPFHEPSVREVLAAAARELTGSHKVRLLLFENGEMECESAPVDTSGGTISAALVGDTVNSSDPFLYHKTSRRGHLDRARSQRTDVDEVIFVNERGEVTEGSYHNLVAVLGGEYLTPPLACGLLPGVFREELLAQGIIKERVLHRQDLADVEMLYLINSVRRWRPVRLLDDAALTMADCAG